jgi:HlyD family secretion protein
VEIAQQSLDVAKQVVASELATQTYNEQSLTVAEQDLEFAQQSQKLAQKRLADAVITAPFDGVVADVKVKAGDLVDGATTSVYIVKPTLLEVVVEVDEMDIPKVTAGQTVKLTVDALPGKEITGAVTTVYPVPAKVTGLVMYDVKISLTAPEDSGLKIGMRTTASIIIDKKSNIIKLPNKAVKDDGKGGHFVKVMVGKNTENRQVTTGLNNGTETEISSGLNVGETVVN